MCLRVGHIVVYLRFDRALGVRVAFDAGVGVPVDLFKRGAGRCKIICRQRGVCFVNAAAVREEEVAGLAEQMLVKVAEVAEFRLLIGEILGRCAGELALGGGEIGNVGHIVLAAAVIDEGVVRRFIARGLGVGGVRLEEPAAGRGIRSCRNGVFRHLDDVGEQGVLDDAVHGFGDVVYLDIRKLFEDGVALAFMGALVIGDVLLCRFRLLVDHALRIAERFVEHVVGLAVRQFVLVHGREGVHIDAQCVAQHHVGEGGGDVGYGHARKPLQRGGSLIRSLGLGVAGKPCV